MFLVFRQNPLLLASQLIKGLRFNNLAITCGMNVQYCAKVMQVNFDEILGFLGLFDEVSLTAKYWRKITEIS